MRCKTAFTSLTLLLLGHVACAIPGKVPRQSAAPFISEGLFEGGEESPANLEALRFAPHPDKGFERWVFDFSDQKRKIGTTAPRFQLRYFKSERAFSAEGIERQSKPAKFLFVFRSILRNELNQAKLQALAKRSDVVDKILIYPPIEGGDMAIEFVLKQDVRFAPHQPLNQSGRLVLDLQKQG